MAAAVAPVLMAGVAACGGDDASDAGPNLPSRLLTGDAVPDGFTVVPVQVGDLIAANRATLEQAETVQFAPEQCRPTADAAFNPQLTESNTVLLVAEGDGGRMSELLSTVRRDVDADRRATTGPCSVVTVTPSKGALAGAQIVTTTQELPGVRVDGVRQSLVVRSDSVTRLPDGGVRSRSSFLANVLVEAPGGQLFSIQVGLGGQDAAVPAEKVAQTPPGRPLSEPPLSQARFSELVVDAVERVLSPR